ncbi:site-specific integrase [Aureimonas sp. SK2]|uniref:site-specific integrase n=1 Tax=Aureimonas sp. SK2 TaxID=3015992 RepID=UPI0024452439|nr:site-specific integrase [Aureimonas sp. SK2]
MKTLPVRERAYWLREPLLDLAGMKVASVGSTWRLNFLSTNRAVLDWQAFAQLPDDLLGAVVGFMKSVVESQSPASVSNTFSALRLIFRSSAFLDVLDRGGDIPLTVFTELLGQDRTDTYRVHYVRQWYQWCAAHDYPRFDKDVAFEVERLRIGGNTKGQAVLSADPESGPLSDLEITCFLNALRTARSSNVLSIEEEAALWLLVAFGSNPEQIALLRTCDVKIFETGDATQTFVQIDLPRMKKRAAFLRSEFRPRRLTAEIGEVVLQLAQNSERRRSELTNVPSTVATPLISRKKPRVSMLNTPMEQYALHLSSVEVTRLITKAVDKLDVKSHRTGQQLHVTPRRLRYTFASRLVREGVPKREVADLLDHTDLQNVAVYFNIKSDIVPKLDKAMAVKLAPVAQAFMGKIVPGEGDALRGNDPTSRVAVIDKDAGAVKPVGTCGSFSFCRLMAPVACYTCDSFQPWMDGPHHLLLDDLLKDRERRAVAGQDGRMVTLMDDTILAVADVIERIGVARNGVSV